MAAINRLSIATAIALRFSASTVTAPSGLTAIQSSTHELPDRINQTPCVLVFPPTEEYRYTASTRAVEQQWPVRFYLYKIADTPRQTVDLYKWADALYAQLEGQVHLGLSSYVTDSEVSAGRTGTLTYADEAFDGVEFQVTVHCWEGLSPTA